FCELFGESLDIVVCDPNVSAETESPAIQFVSEEEALQRKTLFYAVPIPVFEEVIERHTHLLQKIDQEGARVFIDLLSIKTLAQQIFAEHLAPHHHFLLTHPMFGPDSVRKAGIAGQRLVLCPPEAACEPTAHDEHAYWKTFFEEHSLHVVSLSAEEHDRLAARSQGLTHFVGRVLDEFNLQPTAIDTLGAEQLFSLKEQTCNDSWELFSGLQTKNPYTVEMRLELGRALDTIYGRLLPKQRDPDLLTVGIQGGPGSFNEEAARYYLARSQITDFEIRYLYTTENVLDALYRGDVDCGQFAAHNSIGGVVEESLLAMAKHRFAIKEQFSITIAHTLMKRRDTPLGEVTTIMTHPQVLKQCQKNLSEKYPRLKLTSGEGELIDSATAAKALAEGAVDPHHAVMGSRVIAEIYGLDVVEEGLQDLQENFTSFLWVERPSVEDLHPAL
ncbi:prephenate dehydrogenase/arogenate dehydrogenase family protein, partial [bacterium]|nr:prephenate dehydrogenase/arogenate dehydrogenase family protein [bacterium]